MSEVHTEGKQPMTVNLIEFCPPDGRQERITLKITDDQRDVVDELQAAGYTFTCEVLRTGDAVMYLTDPVVEDDAYVEVGSPKEIVAYADGLADKYKDQINVAGEYLLHRMIDKAHKLWVSIGKPKAGVEWRDPASA